jgi:uncharacterized protein (TIGR02145 family)
MFSKSILRILEILGILVLLSCSEHERQEEREAGGALSSSSEQSSGSGSSSSGTDIGGSSSSETQSSSSGAALKECEISGYNASKYFCYDGKLYETCDGVQYDLTVQICGSDNKLRNASCGGASYNPLEQKCEGGMLKDRCGSSDEPYYDPDEYDWYNPETHYCHSDNKVYPVCGEGWYDPATHFCYNDSEIVDKCGSRTEIFNPNEYECIDGGKIYLKEAYQPKDGDGNSYRAVLIGSQTWLAENLNYRGTEPDTVGVCYDNNPDNCDKYGRLYKWSAMMDLNVECDNESCADEIKTPHQGICPNNWHIPSYAEWDALIAFVHADNDLGPTIHEKQNGSGNTTTYYNSYTAGRYLKAIDGWYNPYAINEDKYGFAALPGGNFGLDGDFISVDKIGYWRSASESGNTSQLYVMIFDVGRIEFLEGYGKGGSRSVRCVRD